MNKNMFLYLIGSVSSFIAGIFGGWTASLSTLCILMMIDYITGVMLALFFHNSSKGDGTYDSSIGAKGIIRKVMMIIFVYIGHRLDIEIGSNYLRDGIAIAFIVNEIMSIIENAGLMGAPVPDILLQGISVLKEKSSFKKEDKDHD